MSIGIEQALDQVTAQLSGIREAIHDLIDVMDHSQVVIPVKEKAAVPPPPPAEEKAVVPPPPVDTWVTKTAEEMNELLMVEYHRLGSQDGIMAVMAEFGVTSLSDLAVDKQEALLAKVKALV